MPTSSVGQYANELLVFYNNLNQTNWVWSEKHKGYVRYQNEIEKPTMFTLSTDRLTGEPVVRQNLIVLLSKHTVQNRAGTIIDIDVSHNTGYAWLFRDASVQKVCWTTDNTA